MRKQGKVFDKKEMLPKGNGKLPMHVRRNLERAISEKRISNVCIYNYLITRSKSSGTECIHKKSTFIKRVILRKRKNREKPDFTRVTEVVESCQMCWISNGMQHEYQ